MNTNAAVQSFELRRFPDLRSPLFKVLWIYLALIVWEHWLFALGVVSVVFIYRFWRLRRPAACLQLSDAEILVPTGLFQSFKIGRQLVEEVSLTATGVIIAWKKAGVPHYTRVSSAWFDDAVWRKACPALLAWA
ncbi:hypothetical protein [Prosthecobacter sp.]|uniref:hypothetical protein n=1 Tax=Prosthecobacter sp. TaxID=1965333 RepID=UPI00248A72BE|nr:hypothetical protein [Prosthecobacter sp.]MDI1310624.1 hypothetical protein [Prosthecobacter sp.]